MTDEWAIKGVGEVAEVEDGRRTILKPYRVSTWRPMWLQCPILWAPSQSALGIISYRGIQEWLEDQVASALTTSGQMHRTLWRTRI